MLFSAMALYIPMFDMTVVTIVSCFKRPCSDKYLPVINMTLSPSTTSPFSSTAIKRSPSPSNANPTWAPFSTVNFAIASGCVDPTPLLMFNPSGDVAIVTKSAPMSANKFATKPDVAPLAASMAMFMPDRSSGMVVCKYSRYLAAPSGKSDTVPKPSAAGRGNVSSGASSNASISASNSSDSLKPSAPKNLIPLSSAGLCDAVICAPASACWARTK